MCVCARTKSKLSWSFLLFPCCCLGMRANEKGEMWGKQGHMLRETGRKTAIKRLIKNVWIDMLKVRRKESAQAGCDVML